MTVSVVMAMLNFSFMCNCLISDSIMSYYLGIVNSFNIGCLFGVYIEGVMYHVKMHVETTV